MKETAIVSNFVIILKFKNLSVTSYRSFSQLMLQNGCVKFVYLLSGVLYDKCLYKMSCSIEQLKKVQFNVSCLATILSETIFCK
jgi:hypothetical protein